MAKKDLNAAVTRKVEIAPGAMILRIAPLGWELPAFTPGQFTVLGLPGNAPRCAGSDPDLREIPPDKIKGTRAVQEYPLVCALGYVLAGLEMYKHNPHEEQELEFLNSQLLDEDDF